MPVRPRTIAAVSAVALAGALFVPAANAAPTPKRDSVKGTGTTSIATVTVKAFNKGKTPQDPAKGRFTAKGNGVDLKGPVTCLHVSGRNAGLIYRVEEGSSPAPLVGRDVFVTIKDGVGGKTDKMGFLPPGSTPPGGGCSPSIMMDMEILDVTKGNFTIRDAEVKTGF